MKTPREYKPRITIEIEKELRDSFIVKAHSQGFTLRGILTKWILDFLKDDTSPAILDRPLVVKKTS